MSEEECRPWITTRGTYDVDLTWGWRCTCGAAQEPIYGTATGARESADAHAQG